MGEQGISPLNHSFLKGRRLFLCSLAHLFFHSVSVQLIICARVFYVRTYAQLAFAQQFKAGWGDCNPSGLTTHVYKDKEVYNIWAVEGLRRIEQCVLGMGQVVSGKERVLEKVSKDMWELASWRCVIQAQGTECSFQGMCGGVEQVSKKPMTTLETTEEMDLCFRKIIWATSWWTTGLGVTGVQGKDDGLRYCSNNPGQNNT